MGKDFGFQVFEELRADIANEKSTWIGQGVSNVSTKAGRLTLV